MTVTKTLRTLAYVGGAVKDVALEALLNREIIPLLRELRARYNERHGDITEVTANYTVLATDEYIAADATAGAITITLLDVDDATHWLVVKKVDASANAVSVTSPDLIDGLETRSTTTQYVAVTVAPVGTTYHRVAGFTP